MPAELMVVRLQQYDQAAWMQLVDQWSLSVYSYVYYNVATLNAVTEIMADTFTALVQTIQTMGDQTMATFVYSTVQRKIADHWRRLRVHQEVDGEIQPVGSELYQVLGQLPPPSRQALLLYGYAGLRFVELAAVLGRSLKATDALVRRTLADFRAAFAGDHRELTQEELMALFRTQLPIQPLPVNLLEQSKQQVQIALKQAAASV